MSHDAFLTGLRDLATPPVPRPIDPFELPVRANGTGAGYGRAALADEVRRVQAAAVGSRNDTLNTAAFRLGQLIAAGHLTERDVIDELTAAARTIGLASTEIGKTIRSGLTNGNQAPRVQPEHRSTNRLSSGDADARTGEPTAPSLLDQLRNALVDTDGLDHIPDPQPLVADTLYRDSIAWLIGPRGNGKSFLALDLAGCVATGEPWHDRTTTRGGVLYLVAEGMSGIKQRVRAWESAMRQPMHSVAFLPVAVQAANPDAWRALVQLCAERTPALVVIDTQARVTVGLEENSAKDMGEFVHRVDQLRTATRGCVLVVHHQGRSGEHMRGSTALEGAATTIVKVGRDEEVLTVECAKQKDAAEFDPFNLRLIPYESSMILGLTDGNIPQRTGTPAVRRMLTDWWNSHETDWVSVTTLVESKTVVKATFHRAKKALENEGIIEATGDGTARRYRLKRRPDFP